jgi:hypothetical protein
MIRAIQSVATNVSSDQAEDDAECFQAAAIRGLNCFMKAVPVNQIAGLCGDP